MSSTENRQQGCLYNSGCASLKPSLMHWCESAPAQVTAEEVSNNRCTASNADSTENPSGSTASQSHESHSSTQGSPTSGWNNDVNSAHCVRNDGEEENSVDVVSNPDYKSVHQESSVSQNNCMVTDTGFFESTEEEEEKGDEVVNEHDECQFNEVNVEPEENEQTGEVEVAEEARDAMEAEGPEEEIERAEEVDEVEEIEVLVAEEVMEVERIEGVEQVAEAKETDEHQNEAKKSDSIYKNKVKQILEKGVKFLMTVSKKSEEDWRTIIKLLEEMWEEFESPMSSDKQREKAKKSILENLEDMQFWRFAELVNYKGHIKDYRSNVTENFNALYKDKVSQDFFTREFKPEELFDWVLLLQIALVLIPRDEGVVELLPLRKSTVCFCTWLFEGKMSQENKNLYRTAKVRNHLRDVLAKAFKDLLDQAYEKLPSITFNLLEEICDKLRLSHKTQRRIFKIVRSRPAPQETKTAGGMTGKRSSRQARLTITDNKTKKINSKTK